jgi:hypothetical protein
LLLVLFVLWVFVNHTLLSAAVVLFAVLLQHSLHARVVQKKYLQQTLRAFLVQNIFLTVFFHKKASAVFKRGLVVVSPFLLSVSPK